MRLNRLKISQRNSSCGPPATVPCLGRRHVHARIPWSDDAITRRVPERIRQGERKCRRVEPLARRPLAAGQPGIAELIGPLRRARAYVGLVDPEVHGKRGARLGGERGIDAPAADERLLDAPAPIEERQLIRPAGVVAHTPVVLRVQVQPVRAAVLVAAADAGHRRRRVPEEKIGQCVARELPRVGKGAAGVVGLFRAELEVKEVRAELVAVAAAVAASRW